jgi:glycosyltransferase involved in cell wall biosynthesis
MMQDVANSKGSIYVSIGILAWNEADAIESTILSLFAQSLFAKLHALGRRAEILCLANGCTDSTYDIAARVFQNETLQHPYRTAFSCRAFNIAERGKNNAWNLFVHEHSAAEATFLILMDGDIILEHTDTLWNMISALVDDTAAHVSTDEPRKDISLKTSKTIRDRISLATSTMSQAADAQLTGQLYCIRMQIARRIYLPADLSACEDGFIKALVCTDLFRYPVNQRRIVRAKNAAHIFEAYTSMADVFNNQKRQMIGQTILHVLDGYLRSLTDEDRDDLAMTLRNKDAGDPAWLKRLIAIHIRRTRHFWHIFPGALGFRFRRLSLLSGAEKLTYAPVAFLGFGVTMVACFMAHRSLEKGFTSYWPDTKSRHLENIRVSERTV